MSGSELACVAPPLEGGVPAHYDGGAVAVDVRVSLNGGADWTEVPEGQGAVTFEYKDGYHSVKHFS